MAGKPIPRLRDAVMLKPPVHAFVEISGRSHWPRVLIGFSSLWPRVDAGSNPAGGTNNLSAKERRWKKHSKISHTSSHALPTKENRRACKSAGGDALEAWGLRIYEEDFLSALQCLGIEVTD